jgi:hypothetical protein
MFRKLSKKHLAAIAFVGVLAITGVSVAYFTGGTGTGTGSGTVGTSSPWGVSAGTPTWSGTLTALYPSATNDTEILPFSVTNNGSGHQSITNIATAVNPPSGCLATWFTATPDPSNAAFPDLAPGTTYTYKVDLTMQDFNTSQDACQGKAVPVTITVS